MMQASGASDVGLKRDNNEDAWLAMELGDDQALLLVADGVGGRDAGELASSTTAEVFRQLAESGKFKAAAKPEMSEMMLNMATYKAHSKVSALAAEADQALSMSCTLTVALVSGQRADIMQVGDSRCYRYAEGGLEQITEDQTVARQLFLDGRISEDKIASHPDRGTLSQSIGLESTNHPFEPVFYRIELGPGDGLLLCSDGLTDRVAEDELAEAIANAAAPDDALQALIQLALDAGGHDNITVVLALMPDERDDESTG
ncbi:MAG: protein phosphatase 2C domain-containing protein [Xanthomonadales bacterium]|nr:protein phosphatase 2C domain-containing protein [Xanthomonadales bacterium]